MMTHAAQMVVYRSCLLLKGLQDSRVKRLTFRVIVVELDQRAMATLDLNGLLVKR